MYRLIGTTHSLEGLAGATADFLRAMDSVRRQLAADTGLNGTELRAMARIAEAETITPKQVAETLEITNGAVTAITSSLVERGLVTRVEKPADRRSILLSLTPRGDEVMAGVYATFHRSIEAAASQLDASTTESVTQALRLLADTLSRAATD